MENIYNDIILKLLSKNDPIAYRYALALNNQANNENTKIIESSFSIQRKIEESLQSILISSMSEHDAIKFKNILSSLQTNAEYLFEKKEWYITEKKCTSLVHGFEGYIINRNDEGYYVDESASMFDEFSKEYYIPKIFLEKNKDFFNCYHNLLLEKENVLSGDFEVKNSSVNKEELLEICYFLNSKKENNNIKGKVLTKK